jgi:uncharacterized protein YqgC (DUF456 family)
VLSIAILAAVLLLCLILIPIGLPGTWLMIGAAFAYGPITGQAGVGAFTLVGLVLLASLGEFIEYKLSMKYTERYGGSRRSGWGAIIGGILGAIVGLPVPLVGSIIGAFAGAFAGALVGELTTGSSSGNAARAAKGAIVGRAVATAAKCGIGVLMAAGVVGQRT